MELRIGVDIGGSKIAAGLVKADKVLKKIVVPTPNTQSELLKVLINSIESLDSKEVKGIGLGVAGSIDKNGNWLCSPNITCVKNISLKSILQKRFKKRVEINNDANCFSLEEAIIGAGKKSRIVFGLILGTGTGGGIVIDKKLVNGADFLAGEVGMIGYPDNLEKYCSAGFIKSMASQSHINKTSPRDVADLAVKGNSKARKAYELLGENTGHLLSIIICILNPDIIVIGGGLSGSFGLFKKSMLKSMKSHLFYKKTHKTKIVRSSSRESGILGAAALIG